MANMRELDDFARLVAGLTHDLRVPLGSIVGAASTLSDYAERISADKRSTLCAGIIERGQYLEHLLTSLAAIAKARTGALDGEAVTIDLNEHLLGLASRAHDRAGDRVHIRPGAEPLSVTCDPGTATTLVFGMLDLAIVHADEEAPVEMSLSGDGAAAVLTVEAPVPAMEAARLVRIAGQLSDTSLESTPPKADAVLVSAVMEVVAVLGGVLNVSFDETELRLRLTARLPAGG